MKLERKLKTGERLGIIEFDTGLEMLDLTFALYLLYDAFAQRGLEKVIIQGCRNTGQRAMSEIISLQQARELKAAGLPLNLEVETRHWSRKTSELMFVVDRAQGKFLDRVMRCSGSDQRKYDSMIRAYNKFFDPVTALVEWSDELRKTDEEQAAAFRGVIDQQMAPMLDHFDAVFEQLENGEEVSFQLGINNTPAVVRS
jgi:hypothetical protein